MDLLSLVLAMRPLSVDENGKTLPPWWGRAAHALVLNVLRQYNPALAEKLHAESGRRPFTASTLMGHFPNKHFDLQTAYTLRLTAVHQEVASILSQASENGPLSPGATVELDYYPFRVEAASTSPEDFPWSGATTYQELGATLLLAKEPAPKHVSLQFTSPTTFKSGGMHVPLPLPDLVFGSLLERWNAFAPITFPSEARRYAAECLAIGRYKLSSRAVPMKSGGLRVGAVGQVTYTSLNYDRYWMSVIGTLAAFAQYAGVGAGTSMGLGQCRMTATSSR